MKKYILIFSLALTNQAYSSLNLTPSPGSQIEVIVPYTLGTHELTSSEVQGKIVFDKDQGLIQEGELTLPVVSLHHEKDELVCHLRESLTLNYDNSDFPDKHVCEDDKLPTEGKNSPAFINIVATLVEPFKLGTATVLVRWTIHGVTKELPVNLQSEWNSDKSQLIISGETKFKRSEFNITVKKFLFVGVDEVLPVKFNIVLGDKQ